MAEQLRDFLAATTLNGAITAGATSLSVTSAANFPTSGTFDVRIDDEILTVTAVSGTTFTVTRAGGTPATTAAAHSSGANVRLVLSKRAMDAYIDENGGSGGGGTMTPPVSTDFAWINQGDATVADDANSYMLLTCPTNASRNIRILKKTAPATPYVITCAFLYEGTVTNTFPDAGIGWRQSSDGKLIRWTLTQQGTGAQPVVFLAKENSPTSFNAGYTLNWADVYDIVTGYNQTVSYHLNWFRIEDDGSDRKVYVSKEGMYWHLAHSVGRTDFLTADEICICANPNAGGSTMRVVHWNQA